MIKAMELICSVWIANEQTKQECFTHMFKWNFKTIKECEMKLINYRFNEMPKNFKIILDNCIISNNKNE